MVASALQGFLHTFIKYGIITFQMDIGYQHYLKQQKPFFFSQVPSGCYRTCLQLTFYS